jgi:hypothetical protein
MKHLGPLCGMLAAAAVPVMLTGCGPKGCVPGALERDAGRKAILLEAAKTEGSFWEVEPRIVGRFLGD